MQRAFALAVACLLSASPAHAAEDINQLRTLRGLTVGAFDRDRSDPAMRSVEGGACACPDFCLAEIPNAQANISLSARWTMRGGMCGVSTLTVETGEAGMAVGLAVPGTNIVFGSAPAEIYARFGVPARGRDLIAGQSVYCDLANQDIAADDSAALTAELIHYAFLFIDNRLTAVRVGVGRECPLFPFSPPV